MITYLEKALNLRRSEFALASLLFLYLFLIIGFYIMGQSVGVAMFLNVFPNNLPHAIIATAIVVGVFASIYIRLAHRGNLEYVIIGSLVFFSLSFVLFWWLTHYPWKWVYLLIYIWVFMTGAMGPAMGWTLANYTMTTREARRIFGFIGAGAVLGAPCAGLFTADVLHHGHMKTETLLLVMALAVGACAILVKFLFREARRRQGALIPPPSPSVSSPKNFRQIGAYIFSSRYLLLITALIAVGCASTTIIGYQFKMIAKASYGADKAALAAFFGRFDGYLGLAAFILQMLLTGRLLRSVGIRVTLFVLPVIFLGGTMGVLLIPTLLSVCILKGSHSVLRFSLDKSSTELLWLPVAPPDIKTQIKSFIDGFIWRSADGVAGVALLLFANRLGFSPSRIGLVNLVLLVGWVALAYGVRKEYLNVLRKAIERRSLDPEKTAAGVLDSTTTEALAQTLERAGEEQVLYGLSLFEVGRQPAWHHALRGLLAHPSPAVRQRALRLLSEAGDREVLSQVERLLGDPSLEVRTEALHYLVVTDRRDPLSLLSSEINVPAYCLQGSVVTYLARLGDPELAQAAMLILHTMVSAEGPDAVPTRAEAARAVGVIPSPSPLHEELFKLLRDENPEVVKQALLSAGKTGSRQFFPLIVARLSDRRLLGAARAALAQCGESAVGSLEAFLNDPALPLGVRRQIPRVLARITVPESGRALASSLIQSDPGLRFDILKALNKLRQRDPALVPSVVDVSDMIDAELMGYYRSFQILAALDPRIGGSHLVASSAPGQSLLARALRERMEQELERIFRLLALFYPPHDMHNAFVGITSGHPRLQANVLEVLEHLLRPDLYRRLAYGLDPEFSPKERLEFARKFCRAGVDSQTEALRILLLSGDRWLKACALHAVGEWKLVELNGDLQNLSHEGDPLMTETWRWATARLLEKAPV